MKCDFCNVTLLDAPMTRMPGAIAPFALLLDVTGSQTRIWGSILLNPLMPEPVTIAAGTLLAMPR